MATNDEDLALLLSLQDRVVETPPGSPCTLRATSPEYYASYASRARAAPADMSVFRDAVRDYLEDCPSAVTDAAPKAKATKESKSVHFEKFSGLRIRSLVISSVDINNCFSDSRFIRLNAIRNSLSGDNISGCWVTVGVLIEKWAERLSSTGKKYCIWKIGCLDERTFSLFLFGDAYSRNTLAETGTVYAFFNAGVRKDPAGKGFSISVFTAGQVLKMGTSADYGVCKGDRNGGAPCTTVINKRQGLYCKYHKSKKSEKYSAVRSELRGGNVRTFFRDPRLEGIYMVDPLRDKTNQQKSKQPLKVLSVDGLKKALSKAGEVTTNTHSQGIRFLKEVDLVKDLQRKVDETVWSSLGFFWAKCKPNHSSHHAVLVAQLFKYLNNNLVKNETYFASATLANIVLSELSQSRMDLNYYKGEEKK
ncbi:hypothetical protein Syun_005443 [Stephania yunnanensis]|uniref:Zinc finger Mcm10/DnaG-type domain-containing protein n=1 Tax=Stephania yunnanensis TaxID=152371 RepID=A0AAP0L528_9MAGN